MSLARIPRRRPVLASLTGHLSPVLRRRIGDAIDALILVLDAADGDADFEDDHDAEPIDEREPDDEGDVLDQGEINEAPACVAC